MKKILIFLTAIIFANQSFAQMKLIKKLFSNEKDSTRKASFLPIPAFGYTQETGFQFGVGAIYAFYIDRIDTNNRVSNINSTFTYSTKKSYNISILTDVWGKGNQMHYLSEVRFRKLPFNFYGIGNSTLAANSDDIIQSQIRLQFEAEKQLLTKAYTGISVAYENYAFQDEVADGIFASSNLNGKGGGNVLYVGVSQSYDTRNSNVYPTKGFFGRITYQYAPKIFGKADLTGSQIRVNVRNFWPLAHKVVLGVQGIYHTVQSSSTPFYLLPQLGNDEMMRGYYGGRYRDENLLATQAEIRYRFMNRFGVAAFIGGGKVFANGNFNLNELKPNYGFGGRYFFDTAKGLSIRLDYGVGEKLPNEKRQAGFYISLAEAF